MRVEVEIGGQAVIWQNDRRAKMRAELALGMPWEQIVANIERSTAIKEQVFYSGFTYPDGRPIPEEVIDGLAGKDDGGMKALVQAIATEGQPAPLAAAPSPPTSGNGAASASIPPSSGLPKTGKASKSPKGGATTSRKPKNRR